MKLLASLSRLIGGATQPDAKAVTLDELRRELRMASAEDTSGVYVDEMTALRVSTVMACVSLIANDVASMPFRVMTRDAQGRVTQAQSSRFYDLLMKRPNPVHTAHEFRQMMTAHAVLSGNAYAWKQRDRAGRVVRLWPLMASEVSVVRRGFELFYSVAAYDGQISGMFTPREIMHLRGGLNWDGQVGMSRVFTAGKAIGLSAGAEKTQSKAFANGTRMPGYWTTDEKLGPQAVDQLVKQLQGVSSGENQWRSPLLDAGLNYKTTGQNFDDAQLIETRKHQIVEVCAHFSVVPAVLGIDDKTQAFASVEAMMRWHLQHTLRPWLNMWEQAVDRDVLDGAEGPLFARFDTGDLEKASTKERSEAYRALVELGVMTRNEARELEGLAPLDGLDEPLTPMNMQGARDETPTP